MASGSFNPVLDLTLRSSIRYQRVYADHTVVLGRRDVKNELIFDFGLTSQVITTTNLSYNHGREDGPVSPFVYAVKNPLGVRV